VIVRSGLALSIPVFFSSGHPDGPVAWRLYDATGTQLADGTVSVPLEAVSMNLPIAAEHNTLPGGELFNSRDFEWAYTVNGAIVNGSQRYSIETRPPYGASNDGVRAKLGVEKKDLPDGDISLISAFISFRDDVTAPLLAAATSDAALLAVRDAIEAQAALNLIPTMAVRVAVQEDSGTNAYKRQAVDWGAIAESLSTIVYNGILAVNPTYDPAPTGVLFILATPAVDPITGGSYTSA
jgi:hypothetical protein